MRTKAWSTAVSVGAGIAIGSLLAIGGRAKRADSTGLDDDIVDEARATRTTPRYYLESRRIVDDPPSSHEASPGLSFKLYQLSQTEPWRLYNAERRDPVWAPGMESALRGRLLPIGDAPVVEGLSVDDVECRQSSCRIEFGLTKEEMEKIPEAERDAAVRKRIGDTGYKIGPLGTLMNIVDETSTAGKRTMIVLYDSPHMDPLALAAQAESSRKAMERLMKRQHRIDTRFGDFKAPDTGAR